MDQIYDMGDKDVDMGPTETKPTVPKLPFRRDSITTPTGFEHSFPGKSEDF